MTSSTTTLHKFLIEHGNGRIRQETLDFYETTRPDHIFTAYNQSGQLIGLSGSNKDGTRSAVVVHRDYRSQGIGAALLSLTAAAVGADYQAWIADDNIPSNKMAAKAGLIVKTQEIKTRKSGEYTALLYCK